MKKYDFDLILSDEVMKANRLRMSRWKDKRDEKRIIYCNYNDNINNHTISDR